MRIKKIEQIDNVFSYHKYNWDSFHKRCNNVFFEKINILYGENGNGKTSLIKILKNLNGENVALKKHRDIKDEAQLIRIILEDDSIILFDEGLWSDHTLKDRFIIFDKNFIERYIHSLDSNKEDTPSRRQQRGRNIVYLGDFHKYNEEIEKILALKTDVNNKNQLFKNSFEQNLHNLIKSTSIQFKEIDQTNFISDIHFLNESILPDLIETKRSAEEEKLNIIKIIEEGERICGISLLKQIPNIPSIDIEKNRSIFNFSITSTVQSVIEEISQKQDFIRSGLSFLIEDPTICPFCTQKIEGNEVKQRIQTIVNIFDKSYKEKESDTINGLNEYNHFLQRLLSFNSPPENSHWLDKISQYIQIDFDLPVLHFESEEIQIIQSEIELINNKRQWLLGKQIDWNEKEINSVIIKIQTNISEYNSIVQKINDLIADLQYKIRNSLMESSLQNCLEVIEITKRKIEMIYIRDGVLKYYDNSHKFDKNVQAIQVLERIYQLMKKEIVTKFNVFVTEYFESINKYVMELSPTLCGIEVHGTAKMDARNDSEPFQCGFEIKYLGEENPGELSEGERQVVALSYFFAQLERERDTNKIVIFDDPITNFDAGKRLKTSELIYEFSSDFDQIFIFTCDPLFREYSIKTMHGRGLFNIYKSRGFSSLHRIPKKRENICSSFEEDFREIDDVNGTMDNIIIYGNKLRYCIEFKIRDDILCYSQEKLSDVINTITKNEGEKLKQLIEQREQILNLYKYCNIGGISHYPKEGATNWSELVNQIKKYLDLEL